MIEGLNEFLAQIDDLSKLEKDVFRIVDECGEFVRDDARLRAPVDIGDLRKSITHTTEIKNDEISSTVHTNSDHAAYVEFGTGPVGAANHEGVSPNAAVAYSQDKWLGKIPELVGAQGENDKGWRYISGQPAKPYLYPALKDNEEQIQEKIQNDLKELLEAKTDG